MPFFTMLIIMQRMSRFRCDTLTIPTDTEEYQCVSPASFVSEEDLKKAASDLYGPNVGITLKDFGGRYKSFCLL